jgi:hypothetical protein
MIIPPPRHEEPERHIPEPVSRGNDDFVRWYMNCPPWICKCGLTNFGRNEQCAKWTCKLPRPTTYDGGVEWKVQ